MKKLSVILFIYIIVGCKHHNTNQSFSRNVNTVRYDVITVAKSSSDSLNIAFQASFNNDTVAVILDSTTIFKKVISTDQSIGLADCVFIKKKQLPSKTDGNIAILINHNYPIRINNYHRLWLRFRLGDNFVNRFER
ncbi:MAG TPA: hypothetical protein VHS53_14455, partial [Mucilaginibacter sp.]|nr:hypothetical protein [Mucilaginibacter sp.]